MKNSVAWLLFFACLVFSASASAQSGGLSEGEKKNIARTLFGEGVKLQDAGKYPEALKAFTDAQSNFSAPTNVLHIAECQALVGRLVDAEESYNSLARMKVDPDKDPPIFLQAQQQGAAELASVKARIPTLKVDVTPAASTLQNLQITFNDKPMPAALIGVPHQIDPGTYRVAAYANGYLLKEPTGDVVIREKEAKVLMVVLAPVGGATTPPPVVTPPANGTATPPPVAGTTPPPKDQPAPYNGQPPPVDQSGKPAFMLGAHVGVLLPFGNLPGAGNIADKGMGDFVSTGYDVGIDAGFRLAKFFYVGAIGELGTFSPGSNTGNIPGATVSTSTGMLGAEVGVISSPDKIAFVGIAGLGYRFLNQSISNNGTTKLELGGTDAHWTGFDVWGKLGIAIPAGKIRIVPSIDLRLGSFKRSSTDLIPEQNTSLTAATSDNAAFHGFFGLNLAGFYTDHL